MATQKELDAGIVAATDLVDDAFSAQGWPVSGFRHKITPQVIYALVSAVLRAAERVREPKK